MNRQERRELAAHVRRLCGRRVLGVEFPGGKSRKSVRLAFEDGGTAIATRRRRSGRSELEVEIMRALHAGGARVPKVLAFDGTLLIQEDLGRTRLSQRLHDGREDRETLMKSAIEAMAGYHEAAARSGITARLEVIGDEAGWLEGFVERPAATGEALGIETPDYDRERAIHLLRLREPAFVKWDSRPGNVLIGDDGIAWWFDWDRCGARNAIDDLVWLIADEFVPSDPALTNKLIADCVPAFAGSMGADEAAEYFRTIATFHALVRLEYILRRRSDGKWWNMERCLESDKIGVTRRCALRLVRRGRHWVGEVPGLAGLAGWFAEITGFIEAID